MTRTNENYVPSHAPQRLCDPEDRAAEQVMDGLSQLSEGWRSAHERQENFQRATRRSALDRVVGATAEWVGGVWSHDEKIQTAEAASQAALTEAYVALEDDAAGAAEKLAVAQRALEEAKRLQRQLQAGTIEGADAVAKTLQVTVAASELGVGVAARVNPNLKPWAAAQTHANHLARLAGLQLAGAKVDWVAEARQFGRDAAGHLDEVGTGLSIAGVAAAETVASAASDSVSWQDAAQSTTAQGTDVAAKAAAGRLAASIFGRTVAKRWGPAGEAVFGELSEAAVRFGASWGHDTLAKHLRSDVDSALAAARARDT